MDVVEEISEFETEDAIILNKKCSLEYYKNNNYRKTINDKNKQLSLSLSHNLYEHEEITETLNLNLAYALDLTGCKNIINASNSTIFK